MQGIGGCKHRQDRMYRIDSIQDRADGRQDGSRTLQGRRDGDTQYILFTFSFFLSQAVTGKRGHIVIVNEVLRNGGNYDRLYFQEIETTNKVLKASEAKLAAKNSTLEAVNAALEAKVVSLEARLAEKTAQVATLEDKIVKLETLVIFDQRKKEKEKKKERQQEEANMVLRSEEKDKEEYHGSRGPDQASKLIAALAEQEASRLQHPELRGERTTALGGQEASRLQHPELRGERTRALGEQEASRLQQGALFLAERNAALIEEEASRLLMAERNAMLAEKERQLVEKEEMISQLMSKLGATQKNVIVQGRCLVNHRSFYYWNSSFWHARIRHHSEMLEFNQKL